MKKNNKIPWTALVIVVEYLFMLAALIYMTVRELTAYALAFIVLQNSSIGAKFIGDFPMMLLLPLLSVMMLAFILTSVIYGNRWVMLFVLISHITFIFNALVRFIKLLTAADIKKEFIQLLAIFMLSGLVWVIMRALKHPYYKGDGTPLDWKSWPGWKKFIFGVDSRFKKDRLTSFLK
jgi:hypothetical protein